MLPSQVLPWLVCLCKCVFGNFCLMQDLAFLLYWTSSYLFQSSIQFCLGLPEVGLLKIGTGFSLTLISILNVLLYCIWCHPPSLESSTDLMKLPWFPSSESLITLFPLFACYLSAHMLQSISVRYYPYPTAAQLDKRKTVLCLPQQWTETYFCTAAAF